MLMMKVSLYRGLSASFEVDVRHGRTGDQSGRRCVPFLPLPVQGPPSFVPIIRWTARGPHTS